MNWINSITDSSNQFMLLKADDGTTISFSLRYYDDQQGWYFDLVYGSFSIYNRRIVTGINMLRSFRNLIPFGLSCTTKDGYEPIYQNDFVSGRASLYLLNSDDIASIESSTYAQV